MFKIITRIVIPGMLAFGLGFALVALFLAGDQPKSRTALGSFATGDLAELRFGAQTAQPTGAFVDAEGAERTLADWRGKVVVLNLWGEWCAPCVEEMPTLSALQAAFSADDVAVLAVALDREYNRDANFETLRELTNGGLDFYFDMSWGLAYEAGAAGFPTTLIYDRDGVEVARLSGAADWASEHAIGLVGELAER